MRLTTAFTVFTTLLSVSLVSARALGSNTSPAHSQFLRLRPRACPDGQYQQGNGPCQPCTAGYSCQGGSRTQCPRGTYQPSTGQTSCLQCPAGTYNSNTGRTSCQECDEGEYNPNTGSTSSSACRSCPAGTFQSEKGAAACCTCCSGYYQNETGADSCKSCSSNRTSDPGSTSSTQCRSGSNPPRSSSCSTNSPNTCPATTPGPTPSQPPRRSRKREQQAVRQCESNGPGFKRCPALNGGYECLDTLNDFDSCGGCVNYTYEGEHRNGTGQDCGAIPNVNRVSCKIGKCVIESCKRGFEVSDDGSACVESLRKRAFKYGSGSL